MLSMLLPIQKLKRNQEGTESVAEIANRPVTGGPATNETNPHPKSVTDNSTPLILRKEESGGRRSIQADNRLTSCLVDKPRKTVRS